MPETKPLHCKCGACARIRYRVPVFWVECKNKCGMKTGYFPDYNEPFDFAAREEAVKVWNRMVQNSTQTS